MCSLPQSSCTAPSEDVPFCFSCPTEAAARVFTSACTDSDASATGTEFAGAPDPAAAATAARLFVPLAGAGLRVSAREGNTPAEILPLCGLADGLPTFAVARTLPLGALPAVLPLQSAYRVVLGTDPPYSNYAEWTGSVPSPSPVALRRKGDYHCTKRNKPAITQRSTSSVSRNTIESTRLGERDSVFAGNVVDDEAHVVEDDRATSIQTPPSAVDRGTFQSSFASTHLSLPLILRRACRSLIDYILFGSARPLLAAAAPSAASPPAPPPRTRPLQCAGVLSMPPGQAVAAQHALPNECFPSDHVRSQRAAGRGGGRKGDGLSVRPSPSRARKGGCNRTCGSLLVRRLTFPPPPPPPPPQCTTTRLRHPLVCCAVCRPSFSYLPRTRPEGPRPAVRRRCVCPLLGVSEINVVTWD